jgi:REP element-mobilizing transposase RayT
MSVKTPHDLSNEIYFCTFTCCNWLPLFGITESYDEVFKWFTIAHEKKFRICVFVIMPNHLHFILATPFRNSSLNTLVSNGKRFLAYRIVDKLKAQGCSYILKQLETAVTPSDRRRGKLHQVFKPSFDARVIPDEKIFFQKMEYIHHNPVKGKWNLANDFGLYPYSSAAFYESGKTYPFPITHYSEILYGN